MAVLNIIVMILNYLSVVFPIIGVIYFALGNPLNKVLIALMVLSAMSYPFLTRLSRKLRFEAGADSFGMVNSTDYMQMSGPERKEYDKLRQMEMERLVPSSAVQKATKKGPKNPEAELDSLIGLYTIKDKIKEIAARAEFDRDNKKTSGSMSGHYVFYGAPGTGKTTVARILTSYLYINKCIKQNKCIEIDGNTLKGSAPGEGAEKTEIYVKRAFGGVLFIDEAYSMADESMRSECVDTLIKLMEDHKDKFILILAGYTVPMEVLLASNPGFKSRIRDYVYFPNYDVDSAKDIFLKMAKENNLSVSNDALEKFASIYKTEVEKPDFGNARTVRSILDHSISLHAFNYKKGVTKEKMVLEADDIRGAENFDY